MNSDDKTIDLSGLQKRPVSHTAGFGIDDGSSRKKKVYILIIAGCLFLTVICLYIYFAGEKEKFNPQINELPAIIEYEGGY